MKSHERLSRWKFLAGSAAAGASMLAGALPASAEEKSMVRGEDLMTRLFVLLAIVLTAANVMAAGSLVGKWKTFDEKRDVADELFVSGWGRESR